MKDKLIQAICEVYNKKYIGHLKITQMKPVGFDVALGLNNREMPIHILLDTADENEFLKFFKEELRTRHLLDVDYFEGYKIYPDQHKL